MWRFQKKVKNPKKSIFLKNYNFQTFFQNVYNLFNT